MLVCGVALGWFPSMAPSMAASKKVTTKPKVTIAKAKLTAKTKPTTPAIPSLPKFCAASKAWVEWEIAWNAGAGNTDRQWVADTISYFTPVTKSAPKDIRGSAVRFGAELVTTRVDLVASLDGSKSIVDGMESLIDDAKAFSGQTTTFLEDATKLTNYMLAKCGVDMKTPFGG